MVPVAGQVYSVRASVECAAALLPFVAAESESCVACQCTLPPRTLEEPESFAHHQLCTRTHGCSQPKANPDAQPDDNADCELA